MVELSSADLVVIGREESSMESEGFIVEMALVLRKVSLL